MEVAAEAEVPVTVAVVAARTAVVALARTADPNRNSHSNEPVPM
jgi:hypothetical protein